MNVIGLLQKAVVDQASDIFIIAGLPVSYRTNGRIFKRKWRAAYAAADQ